MQLRNKLRHQLEGISFVQLLDGITRIKKRKTIYKKQDKKKVGDRRFNPNMAVNIPKVIPDLPKAPLVRPPAEYSNSSPYGIASEMLKEQLKTTG